MKIKIFKCECQSPKWCGCYGIESPEWEYRIQQKEVTAIFRLRDKAVKTKKEITKNIYKDSSSYNAIFYPDGTFEIGCTLFKKRVISSVETAWKKFFNLK